ncbi:MAG: bifunctional 5,10-methylenetetrahydrofolate dehydrogenase/5,10-methenyltetrahydrofolate cyclohydrolase [Actinobacteria bacterium]|nr:bifunctional 5,10-methylenetetrahydrofolate dehydrogenase/5,10-methenyltetrahydrofolate cyclohydrolase [Actinomycetota bacterium]
MTARILTGREPAGAQRAEVAERVAALAVDGVSVGLATLLVGDDPASAVYVGMKHKAAVQAGIKSIDRRLNADASQDEVDAAIDALNRDPEVTAFIVQLPLPRHLDTDRALLRIDPRKDADGLHVLNLGRMVLDLPAPRPATPSGVLRLLDFYEVGVQGKDVVIVGRSQLVGRPLSIMLSHKSRNATVTVAHSATKDLAGVARSADILIVAAGSPGLVGGDYVAPGAVVVDVGTTKTDAGLAGDVRFDEVVEAASAITPVPGGIGPMTIAGLLANTAFLAEAARDGVW